MTVVADLDHNPLVVEPPGFDLVLAINFHSRSLVEAACSWLRPGGALVVEGFAQEQLGLRSASHRAPAAHLGHVIRSATPGSDTASAESAAPERRTAGESKDAAADERDANALLEALSDISNAEDCAL